jgi:multimeric flavodoxin WrbA
MSSPAPSVVALNGSPVRGSSVDRMVQALLDGARDAGAEVHHLRCNEMRVIACQACGPAPTRGYCVFHDDMDAVYALLRDAHAVVVASPVYFDTVSAQLKLVMDRCNCITPLVPVAGGGFETVPLWRRTRRGVFVTACSSKHTYAHAERSVRGFLKWVGAKWEETIAWQHPDDERGSVSDTMLARAREAGARLAASAPLEAP